jgi:hypothetical protein
LPNVHASKRLARIAGLLYLVVAICGGLGEVIRNTVDAPGDASATAQAIAAHAALVRAGVAVGLLTAAFWLFTAMALGLLLEHVSRNAARAMVVFTATGAAIMCLNLVHQHGALVLATDPAYAAALGRAGADASALLSFATLRAGEQVAGVFFGLWLLPMGYLAYASRLFPRALGILLMVGCFGYLADTFARLVAPRFGAALSPFVLTPSTIAEVSMVLWLLVKGIRDPETGAAPAAA